MVSEWSQPIKSNCECLGNVRRRTDCRLGFDESETFYFVFNKTRITDKLSYSIKFLTQEWVSLTQYVPTMFWGFPWSWQNSSLCVPEVMKKILNMSKRECASTWMLITLSTNPLPQSHDCDSRITGLALAQLAAKEFKTHENFKNVKHTKTDKDWNAQGHKLLIGSTLS